MITIRAIREEEIETAKQVLTKVCFEFFGQAPLEFEDMDNVQSNYSGAAGAFLVLVDGETVVGTGAIRRLDETTCELKRMWFLKEYRGHGWGKGMALMLLESAKRMGYQRVRLDSAPGLEQALGLYHSLGFQPVDRYNNGPCTVFMEKVL